MVLLNELRRHALARSLFTPTTLKRAIYRLGFVQADPIRSPARAQDLTLRHRVIDYRVGDLERSYARLGIEEDFFVNYGFMPAELRSLMHPRSGLPALPKVRARQAKQILDFVTQQGRAHPREVEQRLGAGTETNYWGGASNVTTRLLDQLHYRGLLRVAARDAGIRLYAPAAASGLRGDEASLDALVDFAVHKYAPLPALSLAQLIARLRYGAPQWRSSLKDAIKRAKQRLSHAHVNGIDWFWPADETLPARGDKDVDVERVRLLAPFDPVVWDRRRFELFWGWQYRFEAYTPAAKRKLGYYALPLLWREQIIGWGNLSFADGSLSSSFGYVSGKPPSARAFKSDLEQELADMQRFLSGRKSRSSGK